MHHFLMTCATILVGFLAFLITFVGILTPRIYRWKVIARSPVWLGMIALDLVLSVLGLFLCAIAHPVRLIDPADRVERAHWRPRYMWLWDNDPDGIDGLPSLPGVNMNWRAATARWSNFRRRWVWSAWRNRVGNMPRTRLGRSPAWSPKPEKNTLSFMTDGAKFWLCIPLTKVTPWWELRLGWTPDPEGGFKSTITNLVSPGA